MRPGAGRSNAERSDAGQATVLVVGIMWALVVSALVLGAVAAGVAAAADRQRAADLAALAAARAMRESHQALFAGSQPGAPARVTPARYTARARAVASETAVRNGARLSGISFSGGSPPVRVRVVVNGSDLIAGLRIGGQASAAAELGVGVGRQAQAPGPGEYSGPLAHRQGKPMRPDVARAFDRLSAAARNDGVSLIVVSGFRSNAEQAVLFARHPDPKWVAPPGRSLHRLGTELDLGPAAAYGWLSRNARRFHFVQRYPWEPWHYGYVLNAGTASVGYGGGDGAGGSPLPAFVPTAYAPLLSRSAQRWNVSATLLAAQIWQESRFDPDARSRAGAVGISQLMPATARQYGVRDRTDPRQSIDAQAHMMRDLLRRFASVPLALAAYNAGPARVAGCGCVPPIPETVAYVAAVLARMAAAGDASSGSGGVLVRLVE